jgi:geranylgeranyl pyrophosphate synthase
MNAPLRMDRPAPAPVPLRVRAHLLHRLRQELSPERLRGQVSESAPALPRIYWQKALGVPLQDFLDRPSKMFRANMVEWAWTAAGGDGELPVAFPMAVEALHAGSLIVDDIEDGATYRRDDVALHQRYGLATALNAGNWLYFWPVRLIEEAGLSPERELAALKRLGATQQRCHLGQGLDVALKVQDVHQEDMAQVAASKTALKTGALMGLSAWFGALAAGAELSVCDTYGRFGEELGNVLQMLDDAGSIASDGRAEKAREDLVTGAPTWPWVWAAARLDGPAFRDLVGLSHDVQAGRVDFSFLRQRLRQHLPADLEVLLERHLEKAIEVVRPVIQRSAALGALQREFERLRSSYA